MLCLSEVCALLPVPSAKEGRRGGHKGQEGTNKPLHLQAITNCLFSQVLLDCPETPAAKAEDILEAVSTGFVHQLHQAFRKGVVGVLRDQYGVPHGFSPLAHPFYACVPGTMLLCPEEVTWLHALNGSLDAYNFLITCLEGCSGSELFTLSKNGGSGTGSDAMELEEEEEEKEEEVARGSGKKRGREELGGASKPVLALTKGGRGGRPVHLTGRVLVDSLLRFFACCFHRLRLNHSHSSPGVLSAGAGSGGQERAFSSPSQRSGNVTVETALVAQEKLLAEVLRRACQLLTTLLRTEREYFLAYLHAVGFLTPTPSAGGEEGQYELVLFVQIVLLASLVPLETVPATTRAAERAKANRAEEGTQTQVALRELIGTAPETLAAALSSAHQGAQLRSPSPGSLLHPVSEVGGAVAKGLSGLFLFPCTQRGGDSVSADKTEELFVNLPIAIQQLCAQADNAQLPLLSCSLWAGQLSVSLWDLPSRLLIRTRTRDSEQRGTSTATSSVFPIGALSRTLALLQASGMLPRLFPEWHACVLPLLGGRVAETVFGFSALSEGGGGGGAEVSASSASPAPVEVEVGSALLLFAVNELKLPLVHTSTQSLLSTLFRDRHVDPTPAAPDVYLQTVVPKNIQVYGTVLVDLFLQSGRSRSDSGSGSDSGSVGRSTEDSGRGQEVLEVLVRRLESCTSAGPEAVCVKLLLRKVLAGKGGLLLFMM